jgi:hypothetical protein
LKSGITGQLKTLLATGSAINVHCGWSDASGGESHQAAGLQQARHRSMGFAKDLRVSVQAASQQDKQRRLLPSRLTVRFAQGQRTCRETPDKYAIAGRQAGANKVSSVSVRDQIQVKLSLTTSAISHPCYQLEYFLLVMTAHARTRIDLGRQLHRQCFDHTVWRSL